MKIVVGRGDRALCAVMAAVIALSCLLILTFDHGRDQGIYALVARTMLEGGMPYRDAWDFKPPGIYLIYAVARASLGPSLWAIRVVEVAGLLGCTAGLVALARRWWGEPRIGLVAAAIAALVHAQLDFWHTAQPETFGGMLTIAALWVGTGGRVGWRFFAAGALFGAAGLMKPPLAGGGALFALWLWWQGRNASSDAGAPRSAALVAFVLSGMAAPIAACAAWFAARGALPALYEALFVFTPRYTALAWSDSTLIGRIGHAATEWLIGYSSLVAGGALLALLAWRDVARQPHLPLLLGIVAVQLLGVALQGKFFAYHFAAVWPVSALLAALGWWRAWIWAGERGMPFRIGVAVAMVLAATLRTATKDVDDGFWPRVATRAVALWTRDQDAFERLATIADVDAHANRRVADELERRVPAGDPIYVWGFEPVIYELAQRPSSSRFVYNVPQRVAWFAGAREQLMRELAERPPSAIVVADGDALPDVTGNASTSLMVVEHEFPELRALLAADYGRLMRIQDFDIWIRRPPHMR